MNMKSVSVTQVLTVFRRLGASLMVAALLATLISAGSTSTALAANGQPGNVYVMTNAASGNAVVAFNRSADGLLSEARTYATGGLGSGSGLGSQGSLVLSDNQRWLFAVNAGSNDVSVFAIRPSGLQLVSRTPSGGDQPISVTIFKDLVYVLNAGGSGNISGFRFNDQGNLLTLPGSSQPLSNGGVGAAPGPAQVSFSPDGRQLVVTEKATNQILTYDVGDNGLASAPVVHLSAGTTPFGFGFSKKGTLIVSEAFGGTADASAVSSYLLNGSALTVVSPSVHTNQTAACWIAVTGNSKYAYTTNAGSGSISGYRVASNGSMTLLNSNGQTGSIGPGSGPADAAMSVNSQFLYVLATGAHAVAAFQVGADGSLAPLGQAPVPIGSAGIAAN
jgi:6-phosphogluconolactonase